MKAQEAIQGLKNLFSEHELDLPHTDSLEILEMAIEALEKQIPKKPKKQICAVYNYDNENYVEVWNMCPSCKQRNKVYRGWDFCTRCGQALDWTEEGE